MFESVGYNSQRRVGGTIELTAFGRMIAVEKTREAGFTVQALDSVTDLTAKQLADITDDE